MAQSTIEEIISYAAHELASNAHLSPGTVKRAQDKVKAWMRKGTDAPLCHKSKSYIDELILRGEAAMLPLGAFRRPAARLFPPHSPEQGKEQLIAASHETSVNASITEREMEANVGIAATQGSVIRAQVKIKL